MELQALIKPRANGTVILRGSEGQAFEFTANGHGDLVCDVDDEKAVANALACGNFQPYNDEDFEKAEALLATALPDDDDNDDDEKDDEPVNPNALPVEAKTPPASFKPTATAKKRAAAKRKAA
jgi:hypothetical protein